MVLIEGKAAFQQNWSFLSVTIIRKTSQKSLKMCIEQKLMLGAHRGHPLNERFWCAEGYVKVL